MIKITFSKSIVKLAGLIIATVVVFVSAFLLLDIGATETMAFRCDQLETQSQKYEGFYFTADEKAICQSFETETVKIVSN